MSEPIIYKARVTCPRSEGVQAAWHRALEQARHEVADALAEGTLLSIEVTLEHCADPTLHLLFISVELAVDDQWPSPGEHQSTGS